MNEPPNQQPHDGDERQRLAQTYAAMTDGELQRLARNAESLTDLAWDALEDELDRRDLECPTEAPDDSTGPRTQIECAN